MNVNESLKNALFTKEFTQNPYSVYTKLRQSDPILNLQFPDGRHGWLISNYEAAVEALKDGRFSKDVAKAMGQEQTSVFSTNMLFFRSAGSQTASRLGPKGLYSTENRRYERPYSRDR